VDFLDWILVYTPPKTHSWTPGKKPLIYTIKLVNLWEGFANI